MTLLAPFARRLAIEVGGADRGATAAPPHAPPPPGDAGPRARTGSGARLGVARFLAHTLLGDAGAVRAVVGELEASVDERVLLWSPCLHTTSRTELVNALLDGDDAVRGMEVGIVGEGVAGPTVFVEWRATGRFLGPGMLNDDVLVEPSGATVASAGVLVFEFDDRRATRIRCFHDGLGLLEQALAPPARP